MGNMMCCSSVDGKYQGDDKDIDDDKGMTECDVKTKLLITQQPVISRDASHQTLPPV